MATPIPQNRAGFGINEVLTATGGTVRGPLGDEALSIVGVATDSRTVRPGEAFVALRGDNFDGHDHVAAAAERGASLLIVERDLNSLHLHGGEQGRGLPTILRVASTLDALGKLASAHLTKWRHATGGVVVALTGSAGKTTTKRAIAALLDAHYPGRVHASLGNLNNLVGVPMTVLALEPTAAIAVLEMGTNAPGEIGKLGRMVRPDVGLVTLIASAHSEGLGNLEAIAREKTSLFRELAPGGVALGNADDARVRAGMNVHSAVRNANFPGDFPDSDSGMNVHSAVRTALGYGFGEGADYRVVARRARSMGTAEVRLRLPDGSELGFTTPLLGTAGALASVAAVAVAEVVAPALGGPVDFGAAEIERAFATLAGGEEGPGRMQPRQLPSGLALLDDSYNANPASCRASIAAARELADATGRTLVLVLGEMRELGAESAAAHDALGDDAAKSGARLVVTIGADAARTAQRVAELGRTVAHYESSEAAARAIAVLPGDLVLVKGSRGVRTERVIAALTDAHGANTPGHERRRSGVA